MTSSRIDRSNSRSMQGLVLLGALVLLPHGIASGQEYDAVERRLGKAVSKGELTLEQASAMMATLRKVGYHEHREEDADEQERIGKRLREVGAQLKAAVKAGEMTEEQAWTRWHGFKEGQIFPRLRAAVESGRMTGEEARDVRRGIEKAEIGERLKVAVAKREMSEQEALAKWAEVERERDQDAGIEGHLKRMGVDGETFDRVHSALKENLFQDGQVEESLGGMVRVIHQLKSEGDDFELNPGLRHYFKEEVDLTDEQVELVVGLARRLAHSTMDTNRLRGRERRRVARDDYARAEADLSKAVAEGKISEVDARTRLEAMRRAMVERGDRSNQRPDWDAIKQRIEAAVERGDLTREEADAKYREIKKQMSRKQEPDELDWDAVKRRIEAAVKRGDMTREEADAEYRELRKYDTVQIMEQGPSP